MYQIFFCPSVQERKKYFLMFQEEICSLFAKIAPKPKPETCKLRCTAAPSAFIYCETFLTRIGDLSNMISISIGGADFQNVGDSQAFCPLLTVANL